MTANRSDESLERTPLPAPGMIIREREPLNLEVPFGLLDGFITPVDHF